MTAVDPSGNSGPPSDAACINTRYIASALDVLPNAPDPFNPSTEIRYVLGTPGPVTVTIFDVRGRVVRRAYAGVQASGYHVVRWDGGVDRGGTAPSGTYYVRIESPGSSGRERLTLLK